ncbi:CU044_5270 family protein [Actinoallomurus bryophytorum]|uniref:CU044_5270 family protein n=1 Tax=Actinoallomurus bryophytorum TaxID=1490222 RepID=UPI00163B48BE|nr:CU044_5270 family protein [Actinoallomurus bryophytorum]
MTRIARETGTEVTDAEIIRRSAREPELFAEIFDRYYAEIYGYVARRLGPGLADDVAAETFLIAFDRRDRYDVAHPFARPWLYGIASNLVSRHHRAETRKYKALARVGVDEATDGHVDQIEGRVDAESTRGLPAAALPAKDRDVLLLVAWAGLSGEEAGRPRPVLPGIPAGPVANAEQALDRAAAAADARTFTPPRPDQWIYTELRIRTSAKPAGGVTGGPYKTYVRRHWERGDGKKSAEIVSGRVRVFDEFGRTSPPEDYPSLAALPTDPHALLRWVYAQNDSGPGAVGGKGRGATPVSQRQYEMAFQTLNVVLRENLLPPRTEAAIFRTMKTIPGVTLVDNAADAAGRPAIALGRTTEGRLHEEVLLDPKSYAYLGERAISIKGHTFRGVGDNPTAMPEYVKKGILQNLTVRTAAGIVSEPGQRTS